MTMRSLNTLTAVALLLIASSSHAFTLSSLTPRVAFASKSTTTTQRFMSDTEEKEKETESSDPFFVKSVLKKQIAYDEKSGRFFESKVSEEDCIPDEEFCVTDRDTGDFIRLTQPEKERIFLDALQVRQSIRLSSSTQHLSHPCPS